MSPETSTVRGQDIGYVSNSVTRDIQSAWLRHWLRVEECHPRHPQCVAKTLVTCRIVSLETSTCHSRHPQCVAKTLVTCRIVSLETSTVRGQDIGYVSKSVTRDIRSAWLRHWLRVEECHSRHPECVAKTLVTCRRVSPETSTRERPKGATVAERLECSPPTRANRAQSPAGSLRIFTSENRAGRCRWSADFLGAPPFPPHTSHFTLIGSQDLVKSRPNLITHSLTRMSPYSLHCEQPLQRQTGDRSFQHVSSPKMLVVRVARCFAEEDGARCVCPVRSSILEEEIERGLREFDREGRGPGAGRWGGDPCHKERAVTAAGARKRRRKPGRPVPVGRQAARGSVNPARCRELAAHSVRRPAPPWQHPVPQCTATFTDTEELEDAQLSYVYPYVILVHMRVIVERAFTTCSLRPTTWGASKRDAVRVLHDPHRAPPWVTEKVTHHTVDLACPGQAPTTHPQHINKEGNSPPPSPPASARCAVGRCTPSEANLFLPHVLGRSSPSRARELTSRDLFHVCLWSGVYNDDGVERTCGGAISLAAQNQSPCPNTEPLFCQLDYHKRRLHVTLRDFKRREIAITALTSLHASSARIRSTFFGNVRDDRCGMWKRSEDWADPMGGKGVTPPPPKYEGSSKGESCRYVRRGFVVGANNLRPCSQTSREETYLRRSKTESVHALLAPAQRRVYLPRRGPGALVSEGGSHDLSPDFLVPPTAPVVPGRSHCSRAATTQISPHPGAAVAERLARSPPPPLFLPRRTGFNPRPGHRILASGNRAGRYRWSAGLLGDLPLPTPLHSGAAPYSLPSPSSALKTSVLRAAHISSLVSPLESTFRLY
ncbi:hypothetical protein PR048_030687, partial [Dryococelus australis]